MSSWQLNLGVSSGRMTVLVAGGLIRESSNPEQHEFQFNTHIMLHDHACKHIPIFAATSSLHRHTSLTSYKYLDYHMYATMYYSAEELVIRAPRHGARIAYLREMIP